MKQSKRIWSGLLLMVVGLLGAATAYAQNMAPSDISQYFASTPPGDKSMQMWTQVLGDFAKSPFSTLGGVTTLLGAMFIVFNGAIFAVGMARLSYGILGGIVGTAQEGQALGQRINTAWYPIRVVTGISGMVPLLGGFTISQGTLMWTATLGIGIANTMFNMSVDQANLGLFKAGTLTSSSARVNSKGAAESLLRLNVCYIAYQQQQKISADSGAPVSDMEVIFKSTQPGDGFVTIRAGSKLSPQICGRVTVTKDAPRSDSSMTGFRVASVNYEGIAKAALSAHANAAKQLDDEMVQAAKYWLTIRNQPEPDASINYSDLLGERGAAYVSRVDAEIGQVMKGTDVSGINAYAARRMKADGWFGMGGWFATYAEVNAAIADALGSITLSTRDIAPQTLPSEVRDSVESLDNRISQDEGKANKIDVASTGGDAQISKLMKSACETGVLGTATGNCSLGQAMVRKIIDVGGVGSGGGNLVNPVIGLKNLGDYMLTVTSAVFFGSMAADAGGWIASKVTPVGKIADVAGGLGGVKNMASSMGEKAAPLISTIGMLFFAAGAALSLYIPMIPFIIWVGALVAYAASFIEGLIAMPLHSFSHLDTDGEGMGQSTSHGYLFYLNTLARPAIMVLAFIIASAMVIGFGTIVTELYLPALANVQGNSITGAISIFGYVVIYGVIMSIIINASFELIQVLPDQVIGFVGAGSVSTHLGRDTEGKINMMFMSVARMGPQMKVGPKKGGGGGGGKQTNEG